MKVQRGTIRSKIRLAESNTAGNKSRTPRTQPLTGLGFLPTACSFLVLALDLYRIQGNADSLAVSKSHSSLPCPLRDPIDTRVQNTFPWSCHVSN